MIHRTNILETKLSIVFGVGVGIISMAGDISNELMGERGHHDKTKINTSSENQKKTTSGDLVGHTIFFAHV